MSIYETDVRQRGLVELRWVATVSRPDVRGLLASIPSRIYSLRASDVYRTSWLVRDVKERQEATVLKYASPSHTWRNLGLAGKAKDDMCNSEETLHCGTAALAGWSDAAYRDQWPEGKCRLGCVIGLTISSLTGPCPMLQLTSALSRNLVKSTLDREV